jgi:hypothetical protein
MLIFQWESHGVVVDGYLVFVVAHHLHHPQAGVLPLGTWGNLPSNEKDIG